MNPPSKSNGRRRWLGIGAILFLPPVLFFVGSALWAGLTYDGVCPGVMEIASYSCTVWEYIGRNTISPFALIAHLGFCVSWVSLSGGIVLVYGFIRWLAGQFRK